MTDRNEDSKPAWLTIRGAAERLNVSINTIKKALAAGELRRYKVRGTKRAVRLAVVEVDALMMRVSDEGAH